MFLGVFKGTFYSEGSLVIPGRFQEGLAQGLVVITALDGPCIGVFPEREWIKIRTLATQSPLWMPIEKTNLAEGSLWIPDRFAQHAEIDAEVVVYGVGSFLEVWSPEHAPRPDDRGDLGRPPPDLWDGLDLLGNLRA